MEVSQFNVMEYKIYPEVSREFWWFDIRHKNWKFKKICTLIYNITEDTT